MRFETYLLVFLCLLWQFGHRADLSLEFPVPAPDP